MKSTLKSVENRCIVCADALIKCLVDETGRPLTNAEMEIYMRETSLEKRRLQCRICTKTCFANERERIPFSRKGKCSDCGGNHMNGEREIKWLLRAGYRYICRDHF